MSKRLFSLLLIGLIAFSSAGRPALAQSSTTVFTLQDDYCVLVTENCVRYTATTNLDSNGYWTNYRAHGGDPFQSGGTLTFPTTNTVTSITFVWYSPLNVTVSFLGTTFDLFANETPQTTTFTVTLYPGSTTQEILWNGGAAFGKVTVVQGLPTATPTLTPSNTPTITNTPMPTNTPTITDTPTVTNTPVPTNTPTPGPTTTPTNLPTATAPYPPLPSGTPFPTIMFQTATLAAASHGSGLYGYGNFRITPTLLPVGGSGGLSADSVSRLNIAGQISEVELADNTINIYHTMNTYHIADILTELFAILFTISMLISLVRRIQR